jgi:arabinofuranosyltransferase
LVATIVIAGGLLHVLYVTRVGGDFMHARMLLPSTFVVLLPMSVIAVRGRTWGLAAVIVVWALLCAGWLRPPYSAALTPGVSRASAPDPYDTSTGIIDERLYWVRSSGTAHPVTLADYATQNRFAREGARAARLAAAGRRGLLLDPTARVWSLVPLRVGVESRIVASSGALGLFSYAAGDQVEVVDRLGLASPLAAHQRLGARGRPGHEKLLSSAWWLAQFADPRAPIPAGIDERAVAAARHALACEPFRSLTRDPTRALSVATVLDDLEDSVANWSYRFAPDPIAAAREACGPGRS